MEGNTDKCTLALIRTYIHTHFNLKENFYTEQNQKEKQNQWL